MNRVTNEQIMKYLDDIYNRNPGVMFGASRAIKKQFGVTTQRAASVFAEWVLTHHKRVGK